MAVDFKKPRKGPVGGAGIAPGTTYIEVRTQRTAIVCEDQYFWDSDYAEDARYITLQYAEDASKVCSRMPFDTFKERFCRPDKYVNFKRIDETTEKLLLRKVALEEHLALIELLISDSDPAPDLPVDDD